MTFTRILTNICSDDLPRSLDFYVSLLWGSPSTCKCPHGVQHKGAHHRRQHLGSH